MPASGVLLYYAYLPLDKVQQPTIAAFYESTCSELGLLGRVRVALDGARCMSFWPRLGSCIGAVGAQTAMQAMRPAQP